jgi:hypothetical protein
VDDDQKTHQPAEASLGVRLLFDIRSIFEGDSMASKTMLARLIELEEAPWGDLKGRPLNERGLAYRLKQYGIKSKTIRSGSFTMKGYDRADFHDAWIRWVHTPSVGSVTSVTSVTNGHAQATVTDVTDVTDFQGGVCDHCRGLGELVPDFHYGDANPRLHKHCIKPWVAKYDAVGDIPPFLDRRGELSTIVPSSDANFDEGLEHEAPTFS